MDFSKYRIKTLLCFTFAANIAFASIVPSTFNLSMVSGKDKTKVITVKNPSNDPVRIATRLYRLSDNYENRSEVYSIQDSSITYTPTQFYIPPHESKNITVSLESTVDNKEQSYQLELLPLSQKKVTQTISYDENGRPDKVAKMGLLLSQRINIQATPNNISTKITSSRANNSLTIQNNSNVSIYLSSLQRCLATNCLSDKGFTGTRLYPMQEITINNIIPPSKIVLKKDALDSLGNFNSEYITF